MHTLTSPSGRTTINEIALWFYDRSAHAYQVNIYWPLERRADYAVQDDYGNLRIVRRDMGEA